MSRIKNYVISPMISFIFVWSMLNFITIGNTTSYLWTFKSATLEGWYYETGHTFPNAPPGGLIITADVSAEGSYSMRLNTVYPPAEEKIWHMAAAYQKVSYKDVHKATISGYFLLEDIQAIQAVQIAIQKFTGSDRIGDVAVQWVNEPSLEEPHWRIWETGDFPESKSLIGRWWSLANAKQNLISGKWYYFELKGNFHGNYISFQCDDLILNLELNPVNAAPHKGESWNRPPHIMLELSIVAKPYKTAVIYWDEIRFQAETIE